MVSEASNMKKKLFLIVALFTSLLVSAQSKETIDSLHSDTAHLTEQQLLQQQQQNKVDELVKSRLEKDIELLSEDSKQKEQLQKQLHEITVRDSIRRTEQKAKIELLRRTAKGFPVILLNDTLFFVYTRSGAFNAADRAAAISSRIERLYNDEFFKRDTLKLAQSDDGFDIVYNNDVVILSISTTDALYFDQTPQQLAGKYLEKIKESIAKNKKANSVFNWLKRLLYVALVIIGIFVVIYLINRLFKLFSKRLIAKKDKYFKGVTLRHYNLFSPKQHLRFSLRLLTMVRLITILLALYLSLPVLFSIFPQTESYTYTLLNWIISPAKAVVQGLIAYLPNLFTILVTYLFTHYVVRGVQYLAMEIETGNLQINGFYSDWARPTYNIVRFLLYAFMIVVVFPYLPGSGSPAFQGVSVFLGILFSLGSSSAIGNIVAGLVITYMRPFKIGDRVKIGEITGDVLEKTMLVTRIRTIKNEEITVPNATVLSGHTINYTTGAQNMGIIIHSTVTIGYDVPWKEMYRVLINAALRTDLILKDPAPFVLQTSLEDFYVSYQINAYTKHPASQAKIYSDLHQHIQDCCSEAGIEIMSPHYRAMRDGNTTTIPAEYLPKDYKVPGFKIDQAKSNEDA